MRPSHRRLTSLVAVAVVALAAGCGGSAAADPSTAASAAGFPVEVTNCGRTLRFEQPPTRIVSGWPTSTELLIALGAADAIAGQYNTSTGSPDPRYADTYHKVKVLSTNAPAREQLIAAAPQLIWADGDYLFDGTQLPTIPELNKQGIQVMVLSGFCGDDASGATVRDVDTDLTALGRILGRTAQADQLKADIDQRLTAVAEKVKDKSATPVAIVSTFDKQLYVYEGVYTDIARLAGATNIYTGTLPGGKYYGELSVEDLTKRNPSTLVYLLSGGETEATARAYLTKAAPTVTAVRSDNIVFLPQNDSTNLNGVAGVEKLATALHR